MAASNPEHFTGVIPHLVLKSSAEAIEFYKLAFGAEELMRLTEPGGERMMHACIKIGDQFLFLADEFEEYCDGSSRNPLALGGSCVSLHRNVPDCDAAFNQAVGAGAQVRMPPTDMFWGDRYAMVIDPFGHSWSFATKQQTLTPEEIHANMIKAFKQPQ